MKNNDAVRDSLNNDNFTESINLRNRCIELKSVEKEENYICGKKLLRGSSASTSCHTPKAAKYTDSDRVIHVNTVATPQTCVSSPAVTPDSCRKQQLDVELPNVIEYPVIQAEAKMSCSRNLTSSMISQPSKCKDKTAKPKSTFEDQLDFEMTSFHSTDLTCLEFGDLPPLNSFVYEREVSLYSFCEEFSPLGDDQIPLSNLY